ncbi:ParA family protein [Halorubrum sp. DTA98]|uniref:ParA family protein n=1 Tax=Halorubrum sp. DTA98 TaxID=3402163 RepID=UPI003AAD36DE
MTATTLALVGATGGAGTTRTAIELAAMGVRDGRDVAVVDAAFATQGLSEYVPGRIGTDLTTLITDRTDASLTAATYAADIGRDVDTPARADLLPARAPFERVARAKTVEAARELERRIEEAASGYDAVIVDGSPVASNESVAAVTTADRVIGVRPATPHGRDALQRLRGRVADVGSGIDGTLAVARREETVETDAATDADIVVPPTAPEISTAPTAVADDGEYARSIAEAYEELFGTSVGVSFEEDGLIDRFR